MALDARLDHVAVAVPDQEPAERRWRARLGGGLASWGDNPTFRVRHYRFAGGGKLELLLPPPHAPPDNFVRRFLERFGARIHHVTLMVPELEAAAAAIRRSGLDVVDLQGAGPDWREFFLRPGQVGGLVVQVAWARGTDEDWARSLGHTPQPPSPGAARLLGPRLRHPDLDSAERLWALLGAQVERLDATLRCSWPDSVLDVEVIEGPPAGPVCLRMAGTGPLPAEEGVGPPVGA